MYNMSRLSTALFAELDLFCLISVVISFFFLNDNRKKDGSDSYGYLVAMSVCYAIYLVTDMIWAIGEYTHFLGRYSNFAVNMCHFMFLSSAAYLFLQFACRRLKLKVAQNRKFRLLLLIPVVIVWILSLTSPFNGLLFNINENMKYVRGPLFPVFAVTNYGFMTSAFVIGLLYASKDSLRFESPAFFIALYATPILILGIMQLVTGKNFYCVGYFLAIMVLFLYEYKKGKRIRESRNLSDTINNLAENYNAIYKFSLKSLTGEALSLSASSQNDVGELLSAGVSLVDLRSMFAKTYVHPLDREAFSSLMDFGTAREKLKDEKQYSFLFRRRVEEKYEYVRMTVAKTEKKDEPPENLIVGFEVVDEQIKTLMQQRAIIEGLSEDFECINYIRITEDRTEDIAQEFRESELLTRKIPQWSEEKGFHNRLNLLKDYLVSPTDADSFFNATRRDVIIENLKKDQAYFVNFMADVDGKEEYYQLKFTPDRNDANEVIGFVFGIHSIDEETRKELELRNRIEKTVEERTRELGEKNSKLSSMNNSLVNLLGEVVESRDSDSGEHVYRVKKYTKILAQTILDVYPECGLDDSKIKMIVDASPLHDIGKVGIPDYILKKPGALTKEEFEIIKTHCVIGCDILEKLNGSWDEEFLRISLDICRYHHEKWDGKGYPEHLSGDAIPLSAQIVSIADVYDALTSQRCYKEAYLPDVALNMIISGQCGAYSDMIISCLKKSSAEFLKLASGKSE